MRETNSSRETPAVIRLYNAANDFYRQATSTAIITNYCDYDPRSQMPYVRIEPRVNLPIRVLGADVSADDYGVSEVNILEKTDKGAFVMEVFHTKNGLALSVPRLMPDLGDRYHTEWESVIVIVPESPPFIANKADYYVNWKHGDTELAQDILIMNYLKSLQERDLKPVLLDDAYMLELASMLQDPQLVEGSSAYVFEEIQSDPINKTQLE